jgi:hypothetical protein
VKGTPFRLVGTASAEDFEPVIGSLADLAFEVALDESLSADLDDPGCLAPFDPRTACFEEVVRGPAFLRL